MRANVHEVAPEIDPRAVLAGAQFADAFRVDIGAMAVNAREACTRMVLNWPRWIDVLLRLRNILVRPFGLKTSGEGAPAPRGMIGPFPVLSETPEQLVVGFDDSHLDFRIVVEISGDCASRHVTSTTLVRTHNLLGRAYLALIMPFHKLVVRSMMGRVLESAR